MTFRRAVEVTLQLIGAAAIGLLLGHLVANAQILAEVTAAQAPHMIERF